MNDFFFVTFRFLCFFFLEHEIPSFFASLTLFLSRLFDDDDDDDDSGDDDDDDGGGGGGGDIMMMMMVVILLLPEYFLLSFDVDTFKNNRSSYFNPTIDHSINKIDIYIS